MSKLEAHFKGKTMHHILCDDEGMEALKDRMGSTQFKPASIFSGIPIYLNECPCV